MTAGPAENFSKGQEASWHYQRPAEKGQEGLDLGEDRGGVGALGIPLRGDDFKATPGQGLGTGGSSNVLWLPAPSMYLPAHLLGRELRQCGPSRVVGWQGSDPSVDQGGTDRTVGCGWTAHLGAPG